MKHDWPLLGQQAGAPVQPLLPLPFNEQVEVIKASGALTAFARCRAGQVLNAGQSPERDLDRPIMEVASFARYKLACLADYVHRDARNLPKGRRTECLKYIESAGAALIALWERVQVEVPDE